MRASILSLVIGLVAASRLLAADASCGLAGCDSVTTNGSANCCGYCGRHCDCCKYCQVVPYVKEVKKYVWVVKCEDYCRSLPGCPLGCDCCQEDGGQSRTSSGSETNGGVCLACRHRDPCAIELAKRQTPPQCGTVHTKKILEKKDVVCKVPSYKCVVHYICPQCSQGGASPPPSNLEPKPAPLPPDSAPRLPPPPKAVDAPQHEKVLSR